MASILGGFMYLYQEMTERIIKCFYEVYNTLGYGCLESVYESALEIELKRNGLFVERQKEISVHYKGEVVGIFRMDLVVEKKIIIELKATSAILPVHESQVIHYLKSSGMKLGYLVNFGEKINFKRMIFDMH